MMQLVAPLRELPLVQMGSLNVQLFKRLARLSDAHGAMPTARIRSLATRLSAGLPDDSDSSERQDSDHKTIPHGKRTAPSSGLGR